MRYRLVLLALVSIIFPMASFAAGNPIEFTPVSCFRGGELPLLQMSVKDAGTLRAYFRHLNTTDWCSVEGDNRGPLSSVTLPKFETGDELEYFFIVSEGRRVMAKSPQIYRVNVNNSCEMPYARHNIMLLMNCGDNGPGSIPSSMGAGYALKSSVDRTPPQTSPDTPIQ